MAHLTHFFVGDAEEQRAEFAHFVPNLLVGVVMHRIAHRAGKQADDLPVAFHVAAGLDCFTEALEAAVCTGKHAAVLTPGGRR
ncbi:hypothetical protein D3C80_1998230 [compost metagenome]